jgi:tetratricopeptide (TPR) repeat protein
MGIVAMAMVMALAGTACRQDSAVTFQKVMDQAQGLAAQGNTDGAVAALQRAYDDKACAPYRQQLLGTMLQVNLAANRVDAAQTLFKAAVARDSQEAAPLIGMIEEALVNAGRFDDLAVWCDGLRTMGFTEGSLATVAEYHTRALEGAGKTAQLPTVLTDYLARLPENAGLSLIERHFNAAVGAKSFENAEALLALASAGAASPARTGLVARLRVELLIAQGKRAEATEFFKTQFGALPDNAAAATLYRLVQSMTQDGQFQDADALCRFVLDAVPARPVPRNTAAALWVGNAQGEKPVAGVVERLATVRKEGFPAAFVVKQIDRLYSTIMGKGTKDEFVPLLELCRTLSSELQGDDAARVSGIMLDLCFYLEKFADALAIVEQGIPGHDAKSSQSLISKIKAHLALQQGKPREAVAHFRDFMDTIAQDQPDQIDPTTGTRVSRDMILGLNAKRIGDILAKDGDKDGADKAYQEARDDYARALTNLKEGSAEYTKIKDDRAAIPGGGR